MHDENNSNQIKGKDKTGIFLEGLPRKCSLALSASTTSVNNEDDMVEHENETLRDRVSDLEKRVHDQSDEITCLRATLADALRRINTLEAGKEHVQVNHVTVGGREVRLRARGSDISIDPRGGQPHYAH